jgi:hypothetical protein
MSRLAMTTLAAAALGTGCFVPVDSGVGSTGSIDLYWQFDRTTWDSKLLLYDPEASAPAGTGACADSGVDTVVVRTPDGRDATVSCLQQGSQGVALDGLPSGRQPFTVTGWRNGVALYRTTVSLDVPFGTSTRVPAYTVDVYGVPDDLDVFFDFADASGRLLADPTCAGNGIDSFTFDMYDYAGSRVVSSSMFQGGAVACSDRSPGPGVSLDQLDRDRYTIRARAWRSGVAAPIFDSCDTTSNRSATFLHAGVDTGTAGWPVLVLYASCP